MDEMSITGNFITNIASATTAIGGFNGIYFQDVTINTPGKSSTLTIKGALELTFNGDNIFNVGKSIDIESAGFSGQAKLIQTLAKNSTVRINFTFNNPLNFNPVAKDIRSHKEITINAGSVDLNLDNSTIAILDGSKKGVINITIPNATIQNTVLAAPFSLVISGNSTGTETFLGTGTRPAVPVV
jgi:hypothetical protein